jgi:glycosyltransferase involved in cell wall biosynthesis
MLRAHGLPVILVDDASDSECADEILALQAADNRVTALRHDLNRGKGAAVISGLIAAKKAGFTHALQVDADGQHNLNDVTRFLDAARANPDELICGRPQFACDIPAVRFYGRYLSHALVWLETLSFDIPDSMCGIRLYPLEPLLSLIECARLGSRMDFDIEVLVRLNWRNVPMRWLTTRIIYPANGVSHYHLVRDNILIVGLHARLLVGMLLRLPWLLRRNLSRWASSPRLTP